MISYCSVMAHVACIDDWNQKGKGPKKTSLNAVCLDHWNHDDSIRNGTARGTPSTAATHIRNAASTIRITRKGINKEKWQRTRDKQARTMHQPLDSQQLDSKWHLIVPAAAATCIWNASTLGFSTRIGIDPAQTGPERTNMNEDGWLVSCCILMAIGAAT
jgi:hypothetical protein